MKQQIFYTHYKNCFLLAILMVLLLCALFFVFDADVGIANAAENNIALSDLSYDDYTDSDNLLLDSQYTIRDYRNIRRIPEFEYDPFFSLTSGTQEDYIVQIVPKELFKTPGTYTHIGREYGFFIDTKAFSEEYCPNNRYSTVIVFDIENNTDMALTKNRPEIKVDVLFQFRYVYLSPLEDVYYCVGESREIIGSNIRYADTVSGDIVIPLGHSYFDPPIFNYNDVEDFYINDISFAANLSNEQGLNVGDDDYEAADDNGAFFIQSSYFYQGTQIIDKKATGNDWMRFGVYVASTIIGKIPSLSCLSDILAIANGIIALKDFVNSSSTIQQDISNDNIVVQNNYTTKASQINNDGFLAKTSAWLINTSANETFIYKPGDYARTEYVIGDTTTVGENYPRTNFERAISVKIVDDNYDFVDRAVSFYDFALYDEENEKVKYGEDANTAYLLPDGVNTFAIIPEFSGEYIADFGANSDIKLELNDKEIAAENDGFHLQLNAGTSYKLRVTNRTDERLVYGFSVDPAEKNSAQINGHDTYIIKMTVDSPQCYTVKSNNANINIGIYISDEQGVFVEYKPGDFDWTASPSITFPFLQGEYYIVLHNTGEEMLSASVAFDGVPDITEGRNEIDFGNNWAYFRFIPDESDYIVTLSADAMFAQMELYNQDMRRVSAVSGSMMFSVKDLTVGDEYYIAVRSNDTEYASGALTVKPQETAFAWYVDGVRVNGNNISLERCWAYNIEFRINDDLIYRSFYQSSGDGSTSYFAHNADNEMNIGIPKDVPSDTIVHLKAAFNDELEYIYGLYVRVVPNTKIVIDEMVSYENSVKAYIIVNEPNISEIEYTVSYSGLFGGDYAFSDSAQVSLDENKTMCIEFPMDNYLIGNTMFRIRKIKYKGNWYDFSSEAAESTFNMMVAKGDGTAENPYIMNCERHYAMFLLVASAGYDSKDFYWKLDADISLTNHVMPEQFYGHFDGGGHTLSGMTIDIPAESYASIEYFGWVGENHGTIKNVTFSNVSIYAPIWHEGAGVRIGIVAGVNASDGIIENVNLEECVIDTNRNDASIGGFAGVNNGVIRNCTVGTLIDLEELSIFGNGDAGFICGTNTGVIDGCQICWALMRHYPSVNNRSVGAAVGYCTGGTVKNCQFALCVIEVTGCDAGIVPNIGKFIGHVTSRVQVENNNILVVVDIDNLPEGQRGHCCAAGDDGAYGYYENV